MKKMYFFAVLFFCIAITSFAQVTTSNIRGLVVDDQNQPLPGASVVAVHTPTGTKYGGTTNFGGRYNLLNMRVGGPYTVTLSYVGFKTQEIKDIFLTLGKTYSLDLSMVPDSQQLDEVVVRGTGGNNVFGDDRTGQETSVGRREITRLPTISRSAADFTRLEPASTGNSFGGRNDQFNNFSLDGAIFNNPFGLDAPTPGGQTNAQPISLDAIDQISVSLAPYDVTQSGFTGASVNAVTKSGTNDFHGTAYYFFRNESLTGKKIKGEDVVRPDLDQKQFGFSIGGPIVKNKLFFFANFERDERDELGTDGFAPNRGTGGINESRVLLSDLVLVNDILSQVQLPDGSFYNPGRFEGFTYGAESTKGIFKLDWNINDKNRLALIYNFLDASKEKPAHPTALGVRGPSFQTLQFENVGYQINNKLNSVQLELNSSIGDNMTNKFQMGYSHFDDFRNPLSIPAPTITLLNEGSNYIIAGHEPFSINNELDQKVFQLTNNLNIVKGSHTFTIGFSYERFQFDNSFNLGVYGAQGVFFPTGTIQDFRNTVGDATAEADLVAFYQGLFDSAAASAESLEANGTGNIGGWSLAETNVGQLAFYAQDEWNVTDNFKLTYGVRFDKPLFFDTKEKIDENIARKPFTFNPSIEYFNPNTNQTTLIDSRQLPDNDFLISPRVGFNWDVNGDDTVQLRGGSGLFTGRFPFVWLGNQVQGLDFFFYQVVDPEFQFPQVWRTNLGLDWRFENGLIATTDISYTKDINGAHVQNWGLRNPSQTLNAPGDNRPFYAAADRGNNAYVFTNSDEGRIWNASFKLQKNFDNGLFASVAYNYLNAKDVNSIEAEITGDAFDFNPTSGNANDDVLAYSKYGDTHRIIGVASKRWTYGNDRWATTISTFAEYAQGGRFNYTYGGNINGDSSFQNNDLIYIPTASEVSQMQFTAPGQAQALEAYIQQDDYLSDNRGSYMERYGALSPWRSRWDVKFLQDYNFKVAGKTNTIQLSVDILNFGNLLNSDWGVIETPNSLNPLSIDSIDANNVPTFTFNTDLTETFGSDSSLLSRWQMQFGVRYIF